MSIQDMLDGMVVLTNLFVFTTIISATIYWIYAQRRIRYLEAKLWLRQVEGD